MRELKSKLIDFFERKEISESRAIVEAVTRIIPGLHNKVTDHLLDVLRRDQLSRESAKDFIRRITDGLKDTEVSDLYKKIIIEDDVNILREKSMRQLESLKRLYDRDDERIEQFRDSIERLKPIRADKRVVDEFQSPAYTGNFASCHSFDVLVGAHKYVYASFDGFLRYILEDATTLAEIDEDDIKNKMSQIVMMDIAVLDGRTQETNVIKRYIDNLCDYEIGKEILIYYLAFVFDSIEDCIEIMSHAKGQSNWEEVIPDSSVVQKMEHVLNSIGLHPPVDLEIRIKDSAKIKRWIKTE